MNANNPILTALLQSLDDNQAINVEVIPVADLTTITDYMVVASGRSSRQVKAIAELAIESLKKQKISSFSCTGLETCEWVLVDFGDVILHVMQPDSRAFYNLEALWQKAANR